MIGDYKPGMGAALVAECFTLPSTFRAVTGPLAAQLRDTCLTADVLANRNKKLEAAIQDIAKSHSDPMWRRFAQCTLDGTPMETPT
jgi:hypothetical protein